MSRPIRNARHHPHAPRIQRHRPTDLTDPITIWVCIGDSDRYEETGTKVAGPVPILFGDPMIDGLKALLERLGYEVVVETTADD